MKFIFYTNIAFEQWDYNSSVKRGIGGSETSIVEMSWRLAARGHEVTVYAPIKKTTNPDWRGTKWVHFKKAKFNESGIWIIYRAPDALKHFKVNHPNQKIWFLWQDWDYPIFKPKQAAKVDRQITLCKSHGQYILKNHKWVDKKKLWLSSNGIKVDLIEEIEKENIKRNPHRIMYASSPDRGLKQALLIFRKAKQFVPDLELHAFYGFNNLDKILKRKFITPSHPLVKKRAEIEKLLDQKDVYFHGRVSQPDLYRNWFQSGIYLYITDFFETSNIASQEAQAMGAIPVFSPIYAQGENIKHGIAVSGPSNDPLTISRAASEVVRLALQPELQDQIRSEMMGWARQRFNWENFVEQWIYEAENKRKGFEFMYKFPEQL